MLELKDEELWKFFEDCGNILSVRVVRDNATGLGKGFGYVNFDDRGAVELALKKNQNDLQNRSIRISRCVKKPKEKKEHKNPSNPRKKFEKSVGDRREKGDIKKGRWRTKKETKEVTNAYSGDKLAEVGKLKVRTVLESIIYLFFLRLHYLCIIIITICMWVGSIPNQYSQLLIICVYRENQTSQIERNFGRRR